jgi:hypothetical protein
MILQLRLCRKNVRHLTGKNALLTCVYDVTGFTTCRYLVFYGNVGDFMKLCLILLHRQESVTAQALGYVECHVTSEKGAALHKDIQTVDLTGGSRVNMKHSKTAMKTRKHITLLFNDDLSIASTTEVPSSNSGPDRRS